MRVAIIGSQAFSMLNFRGPLIRRLVTSGHEVYALAPDYDPALFDAVAALGATPVHVSMSRNGMNPLRDLIDMVGLARVLRRLKVDSVLSYFIKPAVYGSLAAYLSGVPRRTALIEGAGTMLSKQGPNEQRFKIRLGRWLAIRLYRVGLKQVNSVIFLNDEDVSLFVTEKMIRPEQAKKLDGIGVDLTFYAPAPVVTEPITFIMVARLLNGKGVREFADAARRIKGSGSKVRFILLGNTDSNPDSMAESMVHDWVREGLMEWYGHVDDVRSWLAEASVFVLPSYREGLPRSTMEAMAMGRPVITTTAPGCRETVIDGVNGYLVPPRDSGALAVAMTQLIDNPELIGKMGEASRRIAEARFDVNKINREMIELMGLSSGNGSSCSE